MYIKKAERNEHPTFDGLHKYYLILKSRGFKWIIDNQIFDNFKIKRLRMDGVSNYKNSEDREFITLPSCQISVRNIKKEQYRFDIGGSSIVADNINLKEVYQALSRFNPKTLFIKEIELEDNNSSFTPNGNLTLLFRCMQFKDHIIQEWMINKIDDHATTLVLERISKKKDLQELKKIYYPRRRVATIIKQKKKKGFTFGWSILDEQ